MYQTAPAKPSDAEVLIANYLGHIARRRARRRSHTHAYLQQRARAGHARACSARARSTARTGSSRWTAPRPAPRPQCRRRLQGRADLGAAEHADDRQHGSTGSGAVTALVKYVNWSAVYSGNWTRGGFLYSASAAASTSAFAGLVNSSDEFENARYNAYPNYFYVRVGFGATRAAARRARLAGADSARSGRTARWSTTSSSRWAASTRCAAISRPRRSATRAPRARWSCTVPPLGPHVGSVSAPLYVFVFVDGGVATLVDPLPAQRENITLWSRGVGLRLENSHGFTGYVDYAVPRRDGVRTLQGRFAHRFFIALRLLTGGLRMRDLTPPVHHAERRLPAVRLACGIGGAATLPMPCAASACANSKFGATGFVSAGAATATQPVPSSRSTKPRSNVTLNWQSFNISADGTVQFVQPSAIGRRAQPDQRRQPQPDLRRAQRQRPRLPHQPERHRLRQRRPGERRRPAWPPP